MSALWVEKWQGGGNRVPKSKRADLYERLGSLSFWIARVSKRAMELYSQLSRLPPSPKPAAQVMEMRHTANFHPEWGYLAPAPSFIRTARIVLAATAVGAILGSGAVFSRVSHQATEPSVAARTLVHPIEAISAGAKTPAQAIQV